MVTPYRSKVDRALPPNRREFLSRLGMGMGAVAATQLLVDTGWATQLPATLAPTSGPFSLKSSPFVPRVKRVVHFFLNGGPSHLDTFDPKPLLSRYAGQALPSGHLPSEKPEARFLLPSPSVVTVRAGWTSASCFPAPPSTRIPSR